MFGFYCILTNFKRIKSLGKGLIKSFFSWNGIKVNCGCFDWFKIDKNCVKSIIFNKKVVISWYKPDILDTVSILYSKSVIYTINTEKLRIKTLETPSFVTFEALPCYWGKIVTQFLRIKIEIIFKIFKKPKKFSIFGLGILNQKSLIRILVSLKKSPRFHRGQLDVLWD